MYSQILIKDSAISEILDLLSKDNIFCITDCNVNQLYGSFLPSDRTYIIPAGEDSKSLECFEKICYRMLECNCNRKTSIIALGGGVVGDLAGFVSATFMRGTKWYNIPTSLLAQVDSSVGGKTAINLGGIKNIIGSFHLPEQVIISFDFLRTLSNREWICGVGEIVKTCMLSEELFFALKRDLPLLLNRNDLATQYFVTHCIRKKEEIVNKDFTESGLRKVLNLGHTIGHAIETFDNHKRSHGEYVLIGLLIESYINKEQMDDKFYNDIVNIFRQCNINIPQFKNSEVAKYCLSDKKNSSDKISIMLAKSPGIIKERLMTIDELEDSLNKWKLNQ